MSTACLYTNRITQTFLLSAAPAVEVLQGLVSGIDKSLRDLVVYYGEDPNNTKPEDVFAIVVTFAGMLHQTAEEMAEDERRKARMAAPRKGAAQEVSLPRPSRSSADLVAGEAFNPRSSDGSSPFTYARKKKRRVIRRPELIGQEWFRCNFTTLARWFSIR